MKSVVLIGMPGSGKTTAGTLAAQALGLPLVEMDRRIEEREGCSIPALFAQRGEGYFRDVETAVAREAAAGPPAVISTGGGVILRAENMQALACAGPVVFLDRPPGDIAGEDHSGRPLLAGDRERVFSLYTQRIELYRKYAQYTVPTGDSPEETARRILAIVQREEQP